MNIAHAMDELLHNLPQSQAASLMGFDGMPVASASRSPTSGPLPTWLTEYAQTLVALRRAAVEVPWGGQPTDVVVHTTNATVLLHAVKESHYLAVVQQPDAPTGRARFYMAHLAQALCHEV